MPLRRERTAQACRTVQPPPSASGRRHAVLSGRSSGEAPRRFSPPASPAASSRPRAASTVTSQRRLVSSSLPLRAGNGATLTTGRVDLGHLGIER